jgi:hypothetical protein
VNRNSSDSRLLTRSPHDPLNFRGAVPGAIFESDVVLERALRKPVRKEILLFVRPPESMKKDQRIGRFGRADEIAPAFSGCAAPVQAARSGTYSRG